MERVKVGQRGGGQHGEEGSADQTGSVGTGGEGQVVKGEGARWRDGKARAEGRRGKIERGRAGQRVDPSDQSVPPSDPLDLPHALISRPLTPSPLMRTRIGHDPRVAGG